jgi:pimeloyl-ACP methyl ester carboxylesterase
MDMASERFVQRFEPQATSRSRVRRSCCCTNRSGRSRSGGIFRSGALLARLARHHGDKAPAVLAAWIDTWLDPAFARWTLDPWLARVRAPTLVIHGARDEYGSRAHPERIARGVVGPSRLAWLEEVGHAPHRERPEATLRLVADFLAAP